MTDEDTQALLAFIIDEEEMEDELYEEEEARQIMEAEIDKYEINWLTR